MSRTAELPTQSAMGYMSVEESRRLTMENVERIYRENGCL